MAFHGRTDALRYRTTTCMYLFVDFRMLSLHGLLFIATDKPG